MPDTSAGYILLRQGEQPDPTKERPFQQAAAAFLKGVAADPLLQLHDLATGLSYSAADSDVVRMVYFSHLLPRDLEVRSADGQARKPVQNVQDTLQELAGTSPAVSLCPPRISGWYPLLSPTRNLSSRWSCCNASRRR